MNHRSTTYSSQAHIMLLVPNKTMRLMLRVFLQKAGYEVSEAENKREAIGNLRKLRPDVLVIDYEHPSTELEMEKYFHEAMSPHTIPVISLIGSDLPDSAHKPNTHIYLSKPLQMDHLFKALSDLS